VCVYTDIRTVMVSLYSVTLPLQITDGLFTARYVKTLNLEVWSVG
jgi:hypothetical protein